MKSATTAFFAMMLVAASQASAQSSPEGSFVGSNTSASGYTATVQLKAVNLPTDFVPVYRLSGTVAFAQQGTKNGEVVGRFRTELADSTATARLVYKENGKTSSVEIELIYASELDNLAVNFSSPRFGSFLVPCKRRVTRAQLVGTWAFPDGAVMNIQKIATVYQGTWRGIGTHSNLMGTANGRLRLDTWKGEFLVTELDVQGDGDFSFKYFNDSPPVLRGQIGGAPYNLVKVTG